MRGPLLKAEDAQVTADKLAAYADDLEGSERHDAVSRVIAQVADMDVIDGKGTLAIPFDAKAANFHIDEAGPALTDIFPALIRHTDGSFPREAVNAGRGSIFPWMWGTKTGAITAILSTAVDRGDSGASKLKHIAMGVDEWCYDALPQNLDIRTQNQVRRQISAHFIPYLLRSGCHAVSAKLGL